MHHLRILLTIAASAALTVPLGAQSVRADEVPASHRPPAGMCRIWIEGIPAGQQPAPTDCATAVRNRPPNATVVFGDDKPSTGRSLLPRDAQRSDDAAVRERQERKPQERERQERERRERDARVERPRDPAPSPPPSLPEEPRRPSEPAPSERPPRA